MSCAALYTGLAEYKIFSTLVFKDTPESVHLVKVHADSVLWALDTARHWDLESNGSLEVFHFNLGHKPIILPASKQAL